MQDTCIEDGCNRDRFARGLCSSHYGQAYRSGTLQLLDRSDQHRLTEVDRENRTGMCSVCGPVRIRFRTTGSAECRKLHNTRTSKSYKKNGRKLSPHALGVKRSWTRRDGLRRRYDMSLDDYAALLKSQGDRCAVCHKPAPSEGDSEPAFAVDHCHASGHVRGVLCRRCNTSLGRFEDSPELLRAMADYIERRQQGALFWRGVAQEGS